MISDSDVRSAVGRLYDVFAPNPLRSWTDPCSHCHSDDEERALHAVPLNALPAASIGAYAYDAMTTWGDERELRHLLPRILEVAAAQDLGMGLEIVLGKLRLATWREWPDVEQDAVRTYLAALWRSTLHDARPLYDVDELICAIAQAGDDLSPYLLAWDEDRSADATRHLVWFAGAAWLPTKARLGNGFWRDRPDQERQVVGWLQSTDVTDRLVEAGARSDDPDRSPS